MVGEVWLCGGQSNMAWTLRKLIGKPNPKSEFEPVVHYVRNEMQTAHDPLLRQFGVRGHLAPLKEAGSVGSMTGWISAINGEVDEFSGTGYFFGRELRQQLAVPVGLIYCNFRFQL